MKQTLDIKSALITIAVAGAIAVMVFAARPDYVGRRAGHADENYLDSQQCLACHTDHYASWARAHHSRMTQEARPASVQGDFTRDNTLDYLSDKWDCRSRIICRIIWGTTTRGMPHSNSGGQSIGKQAWHGSRSFRWLKVCACGASTLMWR